MERRLLCCNANNVDHHDGGNDGALRYSYGSYLRLRRPKSGSRRQFIGFRRSFRGRLYNCLEPFALVATIAQWALDRMALLSPMMMSNSNILGGGLLLAAGAYQLTPLKAACLRHCRSPIQFLASRWKAGGVGAFQMGIEHGSFCLGCCWVLMALLFFGGVMNLWWIGGLTLFVLLEKILPFGASAGRMIGAIVAVCGLLVLVRELF